MNTKGNTTVKTRKVKNRSLDWRLFHLYLDIKDMPAKEVRKYLASHDKLGKTKKDLLEHIQYMMINPQV